MRRFLRSALAVLFIAVWCVLPNPSVAQDSPNFERFDSFAGSVETNLENDRLPDASFESLREALVEWREEFRTARSTNSVQIEALEAQIEALGPAPDDGTVEPVSVTSRRDALRTSMEEAMAPRFEAEEAFARSDLLIGQIDSTLRARQTDALFELTRTPLDPTLWGGALGAVAGVVGDIQGEAVDNLAASPNQAALWQRLVLAGIVLLLAGFLVIRGPRVIEHMLARIETNSGDHGRVLFGYLLSFGNVLVAMVGVSLLNAALISSGILGEVGRAAAIGLNAAILAYAVARWLGGRLFPKRALMPTLFTLEEGDRAKARYTSSALGAVTGLLLLVSFVQDVVKLEPATAGVIALPIFLVMALLMFRLGGLMALGGRTLDGQDAAFSDRVERLLGRALQLLAVAGALAAIIGLQSLARGLLLPACLSLALLAFLASLHFALQAAYAMLRGLSVEDGRAALAPVLASLFLTLCSLPVFALIWGARDSDLDEAWERFKFGIPLGDASISPFDILTLVIVFGIGFALTRLLQGTLRSSVLPRTKMDVGGRNAIVSGLGYLGITIAAIAGITAAGIDLSSFAIIIGALGVGIGFGLQNIVNNFVSGIILLIERPIGEGDWVEVNGKMGIVKAISVRSTRIQTFDRTDVIVPNGDLISGTVTNWTRGDSVGRIIVPVGVAYGTDTRRVEEILREIAEAHPIVSMNPPPFINFKGFGADSLDFEIRAILSDINFGLSAHSDINHEIARRFAEEDIEIPFAQRDVWLRNPETLSGEAKVQQTKRPPSGPVDPSLGTMDDGDD